MENQPVNNFSALSSAGTASRKRPSNTPTFFRKHILGRAFNLIEAPIDLVFGIFYSAVASSQIIYSVFQPRNNERAKKIENSINASHYSFILCYKKIVQSVNPSIRFYSKIETEARQNRFGLVTQSALGIFEKMFGPCNHKKSDHFFYRHIRSRIYILSGGSIVVMGRLFDGILSFPLIALSVLTLGKIKSLNALAIRTFSSIPDGVCQTSFCVFTFMRAHEFHQQET